MYHGQTDFLQIIFVATVKMLMVEIKEIPTFYIRQEVHYRKESYHELLDN